ncbi:hypothetical protein PIB30_059533 [Stylosanthes scabra]|uniref:Protein kinase domain-containing protein n=1 Tax=Stylosanthes scabra TaxID=79078 RepID=A0ABU6SL47_9FABA|nr:hypothetical protein [Stylosanthes scabra]
MEFCAGGNLASYLRCHGRVQQQTSRTFMQQLDAGMKILQTHGIIHRDLKPEEGIVLGLGEEIEALLSFSQSVCSESVRRVQHMLVQHSMLCSLHNNFPLNRALALSLTVSFNGISRALYILAANSIDPTRLFCLFIYLFSLDATGSKHYQVLIIIYVLAFFDSTLT